MASYRKLKSGKWNVEICVLGVRQSATFNKKSEARNWANGAELAILNAGDFVDPSRTLYELFQRYRAEVSPKKKGRKWESIRLENLSEYSFAKLRLVALRRKDIEDWVQGRLQSVKASTVNRELNLISHCFTQARRWEWMIHNPMEDLERPKNPPHRERLISHRETEKILLALNYSEVMALSQKQQLTGCAFLFALETAMRAGEICLIARNDIYLKQRYLTLRDTKNGHARDVPLSSEAIRLLKRLPKVKTGQPVFDLKSGVLSTTFKRAVERSGIKNLTFHDTRHEAITRLASKLKLLELAKMVGHRDINQLQIYYNKSAEDIALSLP